MPRSTTALRITVATLLALSTPAWAPRQPVLATIVVPTCAGDCNTDQLVTVNELVTGVNIALGNVPTSACPNLACGLIQEISCLIRAVNNLLNGCPATPTATNAPPTATSAPPTATPTSLPAGALGVRRFSIDPNTSRFVARLSPALSIPSTGFQGFLELTAGVPDPNSGVAFVDVTDASEYLSVDVPSGGIAVCIHVLRDQLPVRRAGVVSCNGGIALGLQLELNHDVGVVGTCAGGVNAAASCSADGDCPESECFNADDCAGAGGSVETAAQPHPGVCNGPLAGSSVAGDSGPGAVLISPDPITGITKGLPVEILQEAHTPCGDENATGYSTMMALTTGHAVGRVLNYNDQRGAELSDEQTGVNFSCAAWSQENGPGTLVLSVPNLDLPIVQGQSSDIVTSFVLAD